ncbi:hypothetical protein NHX12_023161 [Muraenolepis orangiensis]|uniref:Gastrin/cholecystokinin peptide hormone domain-containing protein n=1 Tax=Muraenolepis orangiensis TaxID=630683 RepID=A0A9Q0EJW7_9TELE|nr:hypothetical protein NHX12_023161 [Muraenolepis orangiensis]
MTVGVCVCLLLVVLCTSCLGLPVSSQPAAEDRRVAAFALSDGVDRPALPYTDAHTFPEPRVRHSRSAVQMSREEGDSRVNLSSVRRDSTWNKRSGASASHRIKDRDYLGWMDFGRRSAEEYEEYSS